MTFLQRQLIGAQQTGIDALLVHIPLIVAIVDGLLIGGQTESADCLIGLALQIKSDIIEQHRLVLAQIQGGLLRRQPEIAVGEGVWP